MGRKAQVNQRKHKQGMSTAIACASPGSAILMKTKKGALLQVIVPKNVTEGMAFTFVAPLGHPPVDSNAEICRPPPNAPVGGFWVRDWYFGDKTRARFYNPLLWPIGAALIVFSAGTLAYRPDAGGVLTQDVREIYTVYVGKPGTPDHHVERYTVTGEKLEDSYFYDREPDPFVIKPRILELPEYPINQI